MDHRFQKHYTRDEARALIPHVRLWLKRIIQLRADIEKGEKRMSSLMAPGQDIGGSNVNAWLRAVAEFKDAFAEFERREIQIKDIDRGLIDFPAFIGGKEVFLCWEQDEDDIEYWHEIDSGYAGRERL